MPSEPSHGTLNTTGCCESPHKDGTTPEPSEGPHAVSSLKAMGCCQNPHSHGMTPEPSQRWNAFQGGTKLVKVENLLGVKPAIRSTRYVMQCKKQW